MHIRFQMHDVTCIMPMQSATDSVKLYFIVVSDSGDGDKFESDSEPSLSNPLITGPYELTAGKALNLYENLPAGRNSWVTNVLNVSDLNRVAFVLSGVGIGKASLGGGADVDSAYAQFLSWLRGRFLTLIPKIGEGIEEAMDWAEKIVSADPDRDCRGPLFVFKREYQGSDLILDLLNGRGSIEITLAPGDSERINTPSGCRTPRYSARLRALLEGHIQFDEARTTTFKERTAAVGLSSVLEECRPPTPIEVWITRYEIVLTMTPKDTFSALRYVWRIADTEVDLSEAEVALTLPVTRLDPADPIENSMTTTTTIALTCRVDNLGRLEIRCPPDAGSFSFPITAVLKGSRGEARVHSQTVFFNTEDITGNAAYQAYSACTAQRAARVIREILAVKQIIWDLPTHPGPVESIRIINRLNEISVAAGTLRSMLTKIQRPGSSKFHR